MRPAALWLAAALCVAAVLCMAVLALPTTALAVQQGNVALDAALRVPQRLTAGDSDQFLGTLGADRRTLYYASNRDAAVGAFATTLPGGVAKALFDEGADISLPRPSPDGRTLLYLSTRDDATGDVCLRDLPKGDNRRCLGDARTAESHAFWFADGRSVGVIARSSMHGEMVLRRVGLSGGAAGSVATAPILVDRSVSTPAVSSDGKWLVYVPVERASPAVGVHFAMQLGRGLHVVSVSDGRKRHEMRVDLPGVTGFPALSHDTRWLYFVQYLHDTNGDGQIDGDDNGVVYRARFTPNAPRALVAGSETQLTSASWNCRYPAPSDDRLVLTCVRGGRLDVYALPLDGAVPDSWGEARIATAIDSSSDADVRAMLWSHLLKRQADPARKAALWGELARLSLQRGELSGALWYAARAAEQAKDTANATQFGAVSQIIGALVGHRRALTRIDAGARDEGFSANSTARLALLSKLAGPTAGDKTAVDTAALARVVAAEIFDDLGIEEQAVAQLEAIDLAPVVHRATLLLLLDLGVPRQRALLRDDDATAWLLALASREALRPSERLLVCEQLISQATVGRNGADRGKIIAALQQRAVPESELAMRLSLEAILTGLTKAQEESVRAAVFDLYRRNNDFDRRRALVAATLARATTVDSALLLYQFANTWASAVPRAHPERSLAVDVFRQVVLEKAWIAWNDGEIGDARGSFFGLTLLDDDLEAHLGFIEARLREGDKAVLAGYAQRHAKDPAHPALLFARAWMGVRQAPKMAPDDRRDALIAADAELDAAQVRLPTSRHLHHLRGWIAHQRFLLGDGRTYAVQAHDRYRFALALSDADPRIAATLLQALGLLQASVGNHRIALESFAKRSALPFVNAEARIAFVLARSRSRWHVGLSQLAVSDAAAAVALCDGTPALRQLRPLALDRLALYAFESGDHDAAIRAGEEALALRVRSETPAAAADAGDADDVRRSNHARAALVSAANALAAGDGAKALAASDRADRALRHLDDDALEAGRRPFRPPLAVKHQRLVQISAGIRGRALLALGKASEAAVLLDRRIAALDDSDDEDRGRLDRAAALWHRALAAGLMQQPAAAMAFVGQGLTDAARFAAASGTVAPAERIWLVEAAAELHLFSGVSLETLGRDLRGDLQVVYDALCRFGHPRWQGATQRLALYLSILDARTAARAGATTP